VLLVVLICYHERSFIVEGTGSIFLAGSYLVKAAIGETIDTCPWGAKRHTAKSLVTDYKAKDDKDALDKIKNIVDKIGDYNKLCFSRVSRKPALDEKELYGILPKPVTSNTT
jgi:acetyl-CoA carboxylase carboxyltransferase component